MARHSHSHSHDSAPADGPEFYVPEEDNLSGAIVFFAYIAAALVLTSLVILDLRRLSRTATSSRRSNAKTPWASHRSIRIAFLALMAGISFASLSFHMLNVLIQSYSEWTITHGAVDSSMLYAGLFPFNALDYIHALARSIWHWSTTSQLFTEFATAIVASPARRIWTRLVLYYSLSWSIWMSDTGIQHHVPRLPLYFLLAQILPVSFTQHLFLLALEFTRSSPTHRDDQHALRQTRPAYAAYAALTLSTIWLIERIDNSLPNSSLLPTVLLIRALLFAPQLIPTLTRFLPGGATTVDKPWAKHRLIIMVGSCLSAWQLRAVPTAASGAWGRLLAALDEHPAMSAVGYDLGFAGAGIVAYAFLCLVEGAARKPGIVGRAPPREEELQGRVDEKLKAVAQVGAAEAGLQGRLDASLKAKAEASS